MGVGAEPQTGELAPPSLSCRARLDGESETKMELPMGQGGFLLDRLKRLEQVCRAHWFQGSDRPGGRVHWLTTHAMWSFLSVILMSAWCVNPIYTLSLQQCTAMKCCFTATRKSQLASGTVRACSLSLVVLLQMLLLFVFFFVPIHFSSPAPCNSLSKVTCACCFAFSHHVFSEA